MFRPPADDGSVSQQGLLDWVAVPALASAFRQLDEAGVAWCLLRNPRADWSGDVDVLVARGDFRRLSEILRRNGIMRVWQGPGTHITFVGYDEAGDRWLKVDVVTNLAFGPRRAFETNLETQCLARRTLDGEIARLSREDEFWTLLLHFLLDKGGVPSRHQARLQELASAAREDGPWGRLLEDLSPSGWTAQRVVECVKAGQWAQLNGLGSDLSEAWERQQLLGVRWRALINRISRLGTKLSKIARRRGVSVVLLGSDGAGKSTVATDISKTFGLPVRTVYMGIKQALPPAPLTLVPGAGLAYRLGVQWRRLLSGMVYRRRGRIVIFDRYSYDALYSEPETPRRRVARWLMVHTLPSPDLTIMLDAPSEILHRRKEIRDPEGTSQRPDFTLANTVRKRERYLELASSLPRVTVVDTSRDPSEVRRHVTTLIWRAYTRSRRT